MIRAYTYLSRIVALIILAGCAHEIYQTGPHEYDPVLERMVAETNYYRAGEGLRPLQPLLSLMQTAQQHSVDMCERLGLQHSDPSGATGGWLAENIAKGQESAAEVTWSWMHSYGHRKAMLNPEYKYIGVGKSGEFWTMQLK